MTELVRPGIAYVDEDGNTIALTDAEARDLLDTNGEVRRQWTKWTNMSGQASLPPEKRRGRIVIIDMGRVSALLRPAFPASPSPSLARACHSVRQTAA